MMDFEIYRAINKKQEIILLKCKNVGQLYR
jgi:hypothetical protein